MNLAGNRRPRLLHVSSSASYERDGGIQTVVDCMVRSRAFTFSQLVVVRGMRAERRFGVHHERRSYFRASGRTPLLRIAALIWFFTVCARRRSDLVLYHYVPHQILDPHFWLKRGHIQFFHGPAALEASAEGRSQMYVSLLRRFERFIYRRAIRILCLSEAYATILVNEYGVDRARIMVLPPVFPVVRSIHDFVARGKRPSSNRPLRLITVRRLVRRVGVDLLIEAVRLLIERHKLDVSLVIVGEGPERPFLEQLAKSAPSTRQHVTFTGRLNDDDRNFELSKSDLFVIPTRKCEGFGMAILEATAAGIPVVGTPIDAIPEVLESVGMGHLVARAPTGEALANTIAAYWKEDQSLDWSEVYQRMDKFYSGKETASRLSLVLRDQAQDPDAKLALSTGI